MLTLSPISFLRPAVDECPSDMDRHWTLEMMLRRNATDQIALLRLATDTGEIVLVNPSTRISSTKRISAGERPERLGLGEFRPIEYCDDPGRL